MVSTEEIQGSYSNVASGRAHGETGRHPQRLLKGTTIAGDEHHVMFAEITSPQTTQNRRVAR